MKHLNALKNITKLMYGVDTSRPRLTATKFSVFGTKGLCRQWKKKNHKKSVIKNEKGIPAHFHCIQTGINNVCFCLPHILLHVSQLSKQSQYQRRSLCSMDAIWWHAGILLADRGKKLVLSLKTTEKSIKTTICHIHLATEGQHSEQNKKSVLITALL